jgi:hypothetical protein
MAGMSKGHPKLFALETMKQKPSLFIGPGRLIFVRRPSTEVLPGDTSSIATVTTAAPASEQVQPLLDGSVNEAQPLAADSSAGDILEEGPPPSSVDPDNTPELAVKEPTTIDNLAEKVTDTVLRSQSKISNFPKFPSKKKLRIFHRRKSRKKRMLMWTITNQVSIRKRNPF